MGMVRTGRRFTAEVLRGLRVIHQRLNLATIKVAQFLLFNLVIWQEELFVGARSVSASGCSHTSSTAVNPLAWMRASRFLPRCEDRTNQFRRRWLRCRPLRVGKRLLAHGDGLLVTINIGPAFTTKKEVKPKISTLSKRQFALQVVGDELIKFGTGDHRTAL
jgi:hypothetical protein